MQHAITSARANSLHDTLLFVTHKRKTSREQIKLEDRRLQHERRRADRKKEEQRAQKEDRFLRGRQIAFIFYEHVWVTGTHEFILDFSNLMSVTIRGDDLQGSDAKWNEVRKSIKEIPGDPILESQYKMRIRESVQLKTVWAMDD